MAHFYGILKGQSKNRVTRTGHRSTGIRTYLYGWLSGVEVDASYNAEDETDEFRIYANSGSPIGYGTVGFRGLIGTVRYSPGFGVQFVPAEFEPGDSQRRKVK